MTDKTEGELNLEQILEQFNIKSDSTKEEILKILNGSNNAPLENLLADSNMSQAMKNAIEGALNEYAEMAEFMNKKITPKKAPEDFDVCLKKASKPTNKTSKNQQLDKKNNEITTSRDSSSQLQLLLGIFGAVLAIKMTKEGIADLNSAIEPNKANKANNPESQNILENMLLDILSSKNNSVLPSKAAAMEKENGSKILSIYKNLENAAKLHKQKKPNSSDGLINKASTEEVEKWLNDNTSMADLIKRFILEPLAKSKTEKLTDGELESNPSESPKSLGANLMPPAKVQQMVNI